MLRIPLPWPDTSVLLTPPWTGLSVVLRLLLLIVLCLTPLVLLVVLYRYELRLVPRLTALALFALRLTVVVLILLLVGGQPIFARDRRTTLPGRVIVAVDRSLSLDVSDPQREPADKLRLVRTLGLVGDRDRELVSRWIEDHDRKREPRWLSDEEKRTLIRDDQAKLVELDRQRRELHDELCKQADELTRSAVARRILSAKGLDLLGELTSKHEVELYGFHREVMELKPAQLEELFDGKATEASGYTDLRAPLVRALERSGPGHGKVLGVVLLTDGQHNSGRPPGGKARELGERKVPIFPVALGAKKSPPDAAMVSIRGPNHTVFKDVDTVLDIRFKIAGMKAQEFLLEVHREGKEKKLLATRTIKHDGTDRRYTESIPVRLDEAGTQTITATIRPVRPDIAPKETRADNNSLATTISVADDRARVLLVDGEARWEYHYLATALQRDRLVDLKTIVFEQPRLDDSLNATELEKMGSPAQDWPAGEDALASQACIILGDVPPSKLTLAQRKRLEKYVADAGGTLIIVAGKRSMPLGYPEAMPDGEPDPLRKLLPIEQPRALAPEEGVKLVLTRAGREARFLELEGDREENDALWAGEPRPWGWVAAGKAKPGAVSLVHVPEEAMAGLSLSEREKRQAVVARHNYGFGRVLYVGVDSTWRWRYKVGDLYHHRFWGQVIRWAAADRPLVVGNRFVRFGTPQPVYRPGDAVELVARLNDNLGPVRADLLAGARVIRLPSADKEVERSVALVPLNRRPAQPRVLEGQLRDLPAGKYAVELAIPDLADKLMGPPEAGKQPKPLRALFTVLPPESKETVDLERNDPLLEDLAVQSGGKVFTAETVHELAEHLKRQGIEHVEHHELQMWLWPWLFGAVVLLLTLEWVARKLSGLP
jgi:hypothetical protein